MTALIKNGENWMNPLLQFRNSLEKERNISKNRMATRRNGQPAVTEDGHRQGNYEPFYRAKKLRELLELQKEIQKTKPFTELITNQELIAIQVYWYRDGVFDYKVGEIFAKIYGRDIETENANIENSIEKRLLKTACSDNKEDYELINNLLTLQHSKTLLLTNYGLQNDIEKRIEQFVKEENHEN
jgi:DNA sulfur modification protein DndC